MKSHPPAWFRFRRCVPPAIASVLKSFWKILPTLVGIGAFTTGNVAVANVLNSSFEDVDGTGFAANWTKAYANGYESSSTVTKYTGVRCLRINDTSASLPGGARSSSVKAIPGRKYMANIKCWIGTGTSAALYLEYRDAAGVLISSHSATVAYVSPVAWQTISVIPEDAATKAVLAAPSNAASITVLAYSPSAQVGITYFDNPIVKEVTEVAVANSSFETLTSGFPTSWTKPYANNYESSSTTRAYVGTKSLKVNDTSGSLGGGVRSAAIPVIPGRQYVANIKCYLESGTTTSLYLEYWNAAGTKMLDYSHDIVAGTGSWKDITVIPEEPVTKAQIVAPYGASYLTLLAYSPLTQSGVSYFDHARVLVDNIDFATAGVVIANPGFESVDGSSFPLEWTKYGTSGYESGGTVFDAGARSVKIADVSATSLGGVLSKKFPVIEGKSYTATARCNPSSGAFQMYVQYFDNETDLVPKAYTPDEYLGVSAPANSAGTGWQTLTVDFTPPFLAKYAAVLLYSSVSNTGTAYFDTVTIGAKSNSLSNGSFEEWDLNGYPHGWSSYLNSGSVVTTGSTTRFNDIARSLKLTDSSASLEGGAQSNRIGGLTVGASYTAAAKVYVDSGSASLYLQYYNSSHTLLSSPSPAVVNTTGSWQTATVSGVAPANTSYARVMCYSTQANTGTAYFDTVGFSKDVVAVTSRKQLFIDDYVIKNLSNITKTQNTATKMGEVVTATQSWEHVTVFCYGSFLYDPLEPTANKYKLYYSSTGRTLFAHSSDGLNWTKPNLGLFDLGGAVGTNNNVVVSWQQINGAPTPVETPNVGLSVVIDPDESNPALRFKAFGKYYRKDSDYKWWYQIYSSTNGKEFIDDVDIHNGWDVATMAYDTVNARYVAAVKYFDNVRRVHRMSTSTDGYNWTVPVRTESLADTLDTVGFQESDSYGLGWYPYEGVYIGFNWLFQITSGLDVEPGLQVGPIQSHLVFSRDLSEGWYRPFRGTPIIPLGAPTTWEDGVQYTASYATQVGNEVYMYYGAFDAPHAMPATGASIGLAKWRLDGFVSLNAGGTEGTITTKTLTYTGTSLKLNVNSTGAGNYVKVELLDSSGNVISGYAKANCPDITTDSVNHTVTWDAPKGTTVPLAGTEVQVKIYAKNAKVYALQFQ